MFDIGWSELLLVGVIALVVVGPKELPGLLYTVGQWIRRGRMVASNFQSTVDQMMREAELDKTRKELEAQFREQENAILAVTTRSETPAAVPAPETAPAPEAAVTASVEVAAAAALSAEPAPSAPAAPVELTAQPPLTTPSPTMAETVPSTDEKNRA